MWLPIMALPDGAEISMNWPGRDGEDVASHTYRVSREGKTIGEFTRLNDVALFVRHRHDQATHDAFITAQQRLASSPKPGRVRARTG